jgi:hypothetical protein
LNLPVKRHHLVENDLLDLAEWIAATSFETACRFLDAAEESVEGLGFLPGRGSPKHLQGRGLEGIRSWAVQGFPNHLIMYDQRPDAIYVVAVIWGSRDYTELLQDRLRD